MAIAFPLTVTLASSIEPDNTRTITATVTDAGAVVLFAQQKQFPAEVGIGFIRSFAVRWFNELLATLADKVLATGNLSVTLSLKDVLDLSRR